MSKIVLVPIGHGLFEVISHAFVGTALLPRTVIYGCELVAICILYADYVICKRGPICGASESVCLEEEVPASYCLPATIKKKGVCGSKTCPGTQLKQETLLETLNRKRSSICSAIIPEPEPKTPCEAKPKASVVMPCGSKQEPPEPKREPCAAGRESEPKKDESKKEPCRGRCLKQRPKE